MQKTPTSQSDHLSLLIETGAQDMKTFAKLLTAIDHLGVQSLANKKLISPPNSAFRLGITGPPGAGKSTLVSQLLTQLKHLDLKIGVLAVDPSSPFSKGAILGDRIRYSQHFLDPRIFIRSLGTRGSLGGLSGSAYLMLRAFDACLFDVVLIETVGVGQTELEVLHVADDIAVVLVPESGDSIQAMKAGLSEIADVFIVNKSDRPGADSLVRELEAAAQLGETPPPPIFKTVASTGFGMSDLLKYVVKKRAAFHAKNSKRFQNIENLQGEARALLRNALERSIEAQVATVCDAVSFQKIFQTVK